MIRVLLDTNVMLDSILQRPPWHRDADAILNEASLGRVSCAVASLTLATVFYVARMSVGTVLARSAVSRSILALDVVAIDKKTLLDADAMPGTDFEDNILIAAATEAVLDGIVTRNPKDFAHSPVPVWEPAELLKLLGSVSSPPGSGGSAVPGPP